MDVLKDLDFDEIFSEIMVDQTATVSNVNNAPEAEPKPEEEAPTSSPKPSTSTTNTRFNIATEDDLKQLEQQRHSKSTLKNTKWALKLFNGELPDFVTVTRPSVT